MEHELAAPDFSTLLWPTANFIVYAVLMVYLYRKHASPAIRAWSKEVEEFLRKSAGHLAEATGHLEEAEERLGLIDGEKATLRRSYQVEGEKLAKSIVENARASALQIEKESGRQVERELHQAEKELRYEVILEATERARKKLREGLTDEDDRKLRQAALRGFILEEPLGLGRSN